MAQSAHFSATAIFTGCRRAKRYALELYQHLKVRIMMNRSHRIACITFGLLLVVSHVVSAEEWPTFSQLLNKSNYNVRTQELQRGVPGGERPIGYLGSCLLASRRLQTSDLRGKTLYL